MYIIFAGLAGNHLPMSHRLSPLRACAWVPGDVLLRWRI